MCEGGLLFCFTAFVSSMTDKTGFPFKVAMKSFPLNNKFRNAVSIELQQPNKPRILMSDSSGSILRDGVWK